MSHEPHQPLRGMRIVDVTTSIAGPYCAQILSALGADVVKVERPDTGDDGRAWGPPFWNGESTMFLSANAGKRSLALSLRDPRGRAALLRIVDRADIFLQSLRATLRDMGPGNPDTCLHLDLDGRDPEDGVNDIAFCRLTSHDVVRHRLVGRIVAAYDRFEATLPPVRKN